MSEGALNSGQRPLGEVHQGSQLVWWRDYPGE